MDRERCKELLPVLQAFAEGKTIQCRGMGLDWAAVSTNPTWEADEYRIKPEPREFWINPKTNKITSTMPDVARDPMTGFIKVVEVLDD